MQRKRGVNATKNAFDVADQERSFDTKHEIASALQRSVTARIAPLALAVIRAIDLNHEPVGGREEVRDVAPEQRHLPAKGHA